MAVATEFLYRNYDSSDATISTAYSNELFPTIENVGWAAQAGHIFKEWNTSRDGTGASFDPGDSFPSPASYTTFYAIWEECDVSISYKGSAIATMSASGTKTLETEGKYCEDDITVTYTKTAGSASTPATTITANPSISVSSGGLITASVSASQSVTPTVSAGYVSSGTAGTVSVSGSATQQLSVYAGAHHQPTPADYSVTVSLTNPVNASEFSYCDINEQITSANNDTGSLLVSISSASGNATVTVSASIYGIQVVPVGMSVHVTGGISCTGGVTYAGADPMGGYKFAVTGNGTVTFDGIDYDD